MNAWQATIAAVALGVACTAGGQTSTPAPTQQQRQQDLKGAEKAGQRDDTLPMTAAQQAQYKQEYDAAKTKWAAMTPQQRQATISGARTKKLSELSAIELVGQRDDMRREMAAQSAQLKAEADAAKAKWDKLTPAEKQAYRKSAWQKRRADLDGMEAVGQRDDSYVLPF
jgi:trehalose/maltose hydrolase-like predicted phosphorylase